MKKQNSVQFRAVCADGLCAVTALRRKAPMLAREPNDPLDLAETVEVFISIGARAALPTGQLQAGNGRQVSATTAA